MTQHPVKTLLVIALLLIGVLWLAGCTHVGIEPDIFEEINERAGG